MEQLKVNMLGGFSVSYGEKTIDDQLNRSRKIWTLLEYLITFRDREIPQEEIIELLWPEDEADDPANRLKTLLHRTRSTLALLEVPDAKKLIRCRGGTYAWDESAVCVVDAEEFDALCKEAAEPGLSDEARIEKSLAAAALYSGDFLPKNALDDWVVPLNTYYRTKYIKLVTSACDLLQEAGRNEEIVELCQKAAVIDPYEEYIHLCLIRALIATNRQQQAIRHYDYVSELFFSKFGITPSAELTAVYKDVVRTTKSLELDIGIVKDGLREQERQEGCFFCEYEFFKSVYQLEARAAARTGASVFICLVTVTDGRGEKPELKVMNKSMEALKETISNTLRRGDVFTRYSVSQYLVLLPTTSYENGEMVMQRIQRAFHRENPKSRVQIVYSLQPLTPEF